MRIHNVSTAELVRTIEGNLLVRYFVRGQMLTITLIAEGTMDVQFKDLRPWGNSGGGIIPLTQGDKMSRMDQ